MFFYINNGYFNFYVCGVIETQTIENTEKYNRKDWLKMEVKCKYCNCTEYDTVPKGPHIGAYCKNCGKFIKWVPKCSCKTVSSGVSVGTGVQTSGIVTNNVNNSIPEPVLGTEKAQLLYSAGSLMLHVEDKYIKLYEAQDMMERFRVVLKQGNTKTELVQGEQLNIYIM